MHPLDVRYSSFLQPALTTDVKTLRYQKLKEYLENKRWREADPETYRLMITTVGKEEGQLFDKEDLLNFPCEDLKIIDGLWVNHSQGKWGFSIQKQIYADCGAKLDGSYPGDAVWHDFCTRQIKCFDDLLPGTQTPDSRVLLSRCRCR